MNDSVSYFLSSKHFFFLSLRSFISAGSDGRIKIWDDISEKKRQEEENIRAEKARNEQILTNLMQQNHYSEALSFSLTLAKPYRYSEFYNL